MRKKRKDKKVEVSNTGNNTETGSGAWELATTWGCSQGWLPDTAVPSRGFKFVCKTLQCCLGSQTDKSACSSNTSYPVFERRYLFFKQWKQRVLFLCLVTFSKTQIYHLWPGNRPCYGNYSKNKCKWQIPQKSEAIWWPPPYVRRWDTAKQLDLQKFHRSFITALFLLFSLFFPFQFSTFFTQSSERTYAGLHSSLPAHRRLMSP